MATPVTLVDASGQEVGITGSPLVVDGAAGGSGATTTARLPSSAATTNATVAKNAAGDLFSLIGFNTNAAVRYLKIYDKATAPTVGTDTPVLTIPLVPSAGFAIDFAPLSFSLGIGYALTTGAADADTGAVGAGDIVGLNVVFA